MESPFGPHESNQSLSVSTPAVASADSAKMTPEDAAVMIYASLQKEGYTSQEKIDVLNFLKSNVKDEIQESIQALGRLKQSF